MWAITCTFTSVFGADIFIMALSAPLLHPLEWPSWEILDGEGLASRENFGMSALFQEWFVDEEPSLQFATTSFLTIWKARVFRELAPNLHSMK